MAPKWQAPTGATVQALSSLDEIMRTNMEGSKVPRGALAVAKGRRLVFARG